MCVYINTHLPYHSFPIQLGRALRVAFKTAAAAFQARCSAPSATSAIVCNAALRPTTGQGN